MFMICAKSLFERCLERTADGYTSEVVCYVFSTQINISEIKHEKASIFDAYSGSKFDCEVFELESCEQDNEILKDWEDEKLTLKLSGKLFDCYPAYYFNGKHPRGYQVDSQKDDRFIRLKRLPKKV